MKSFQVDFLLAEQYYFETFITGLLIESGGLIKVLKRVKSTRVSLVAGNTVDSLLMDTSLYNRLLGLDNSLIRWTVGASPKMSETSHTEGRALTNCANPSSKVQLWSNLQLLFSSFPGSVLEKAGGKEFKDEVKKLSESHGPLELASGNDFVRDVAEQHQQNLDHVNPCNSFPNLFAGDKGSPQSLSPGYYGCITHQCCNCSLSSYFSQRPSAMVEI